MPGFESESRRHGRFTRRALLLGSAQAALLGVLGHRLYDIQVTHARRYQLLADENRISTQGSAPIRGNIRDRFGIVLAQSEERLEAAVVPDLAGDVASIVSRLGKVIAITPEDRERILALAGRQSRLIPILVRSGLTWEELARISVLAPQLPGVFTQTGAVRHYFRGADIGHVVGLVGAPDQQDLSTDPSLRLPGVRIGKAGIELGMETALRGSAGEITREVDAHGRIVRDLDERPSIRGSDLVLTIDTDLQTSVLKRMAAEDFAAVVALDAQTGEVLTMASTPTYDTASVAEGINKEDWQQLVDREGDPLVNKAIRGQYPPGSTFKMVTAMAALDAGLVTHKTRFTCQGSLELSGQRFGCWKLGGHGSVRLHDALKESCDVYFYELARLCGIERIAAAARKLGFGSALECGIGGQKPGLIPDPAWKQAALNNRWYAGETLLAAIGQGYVLATPLQLAVMTARLATGRAIEPKLLRPDHGRSAAPAATLSFDAGSLELVRQGMIAAVNEGGGTASSASLPIRGAIMAGKTGTAQVSRASHGRSSASLERKLRDHSLFVGYAPASAPRYAVAAIVEHGGGGSKVAAPLVRDVMTMLLERDPLSQPAYPLDAPTAARADAAPLATKPNG